MYTCTPLLDDERALSPPHLKMTSSHSSSASSSKPSAQEKSEESADPTHSGGEQVSERTLYTESRGTWRILISDRRRAGRCRGKVPLQQVSGWLPWPGRDVASPSSPAWPPHPRSPARPSACSTRAPCYPDAFPPQLAPDLPAPDRQQPLSFFLLLRHAHDLLQPTPSWNCWRCGPCCVLRCVSTGGGKFQDRAERLDPEPATRVSRWTRLARRPVGRVPWRRRTGRLQDLFCTTEILHFLLELRDQSLLTPVVVRGSLPDHPLRRANPATNVSLSMPSPRPPARSNHAELSCLFLHLQDDSHCLFPQLSGICLFPGYSWSNLPRGHTLSRNRRSNHHYTRPDHAGN